MKYKPPKFENLADMSAIDVERLTEDEARAMLEKVRWANGLVCPHCGGLNVTRLAPKAESVRDGVIQCNDCRKQFTVTVGTIMERSHITLRQWIQAFHALCSSKKGVSALQLQRNLGIRSYKCAWHLAHRIRLAMKDSLTPPLKGIVEVDETYVGGKPRKGARDKNGDLIVNKRGRGTKKTPVMALIERNGKARIKVLDVVDAANLKSVIRENVNRNAMIMTDEFQAYSGIGKEFKGHKTVNHSKGVYARTRKIKGRRIKIHTNTGESFFALLKRGVHGIFHHVSRTHLQRYCDEFSFRWDRRKVTDGERTVSAIKGMDGKRLTYKPLVQGV